jgi:fumarate reductase flavoprotein subunit
MKKFMKRFMSLLLAAAMVASLAGCSSQGSAGTTTEAAVEETATENTTAAADNEATTYVPGTYTGTGTGKNGAVTVEVTVSENAIEDIVVTESNESSGIGDVAAERVISQVLDNQSLKVDAVSGCTISRMAFVTAIEDALTQAGADIAALEKVPVAAKAGLASNVQEADVVVVGSGAAGMTAALEAAYAGSSVIVLEKLSYIGGSSRLSSAMLVVGGSKLQEEAGIEDSVDNLKAYWVERGEGLIDQEWTDYAAENINDALEWFMDLGVNYNSSLILQSGTATINRAHMPAESGRELMDRLVEEAEKYDIQILTDTKATALIQDETGAVTGVEAEYNGETLTVNGKAVILATGGYAASQEKLAEYSPKAVGSLYVGAVGATGDGIDMGLSAGADTVFKGGYIGWKAVTISYDHTNAVGAPIYGAANLVVDSKGDRFGNENLDYPFMYEDMVTDGDDTFYFIFETSTSETTDLVNNVSDTTANLELGVAAGVCYKADTIEELAEISGMTDLVATVEQYNGAIESGVDETYGRDTSTMTAIANGPFYALQCKKALLGTFGGLKTQITGEVLDTNGDAIQGLYAAGEVANGDFFPTIYPASGSAMDCAVVFGREAGRSAAAYAATK